MGHNLAIVVGINEYERLKRLKIREAGRAQGQGFA